MIASLVDRLIRSQRWLDPFGGFIQKVVGGIYKPFGAVGQRTKSFLHGAWLGHAVHPAITDVPLGAWTVAIVADLVAFTGRVSPQVGDFCVFIGVLGALAAAATGYTDHHETFGHERRVATAHGLLMSVTILLYTASFLLRWLGTAPVHGLAVWLAVGGYALLVTGAYLGGDLVFALGTMVNRNAFSEGPEKDFVKVGTPADFPEGQLTKVEAGGMGVLMVRVGGRLTAVASTCSHAGGPLEEGELRGVKVTCPWHGSQFDVTTGRVKLGPATCELPLFVVREEAGAVLVKLSRSLHS